MGIIDWVFGKVKNAATTFKNAVTSFKNKFFKPDEEEVEEYDTALDIDKKINTFLKTRKAIEDYSSQGFPFADRLKKTYDSSESQAIDAAIEKLEKEIAILKEIKKKGKKSKPMRLSENAILKEIKKKGMPMPLSGSEYAYLVEVSFRLTVVCKRGGERVIMGHVKYVKKLSSVEECEEFVNGVLSSPPYHVGDTIEVDGETCIIVDVEPIVKINGMKIGSGSETTKEEGLSRWIENV